jgi:hypothetical protein
MTLHNRLMLAAVVFSFVACGAGTSSTTATLSVRGGTMALESGAQLTVPADALKQDTEVTLREVHHGGDVSIEVEPSGLVLEQPADVSWSDDGRGVAENEGGEQLESEHRGDNREHHSMRTLGTVWFRHDGDGGRHHGSDDLDGGSGADARDGGDDHGVDAADGGDDHGVDADAGADGGDDSGHGGH